MRKVEISPELRMASQEKSLFRQRRQAGCHRQIVSQCPGEVERRRAWSGDLGAPEGAFAAVSAMGGDGHHCPADNAAFQLLALIGRGQLQQLTGEARDRA
jgi:hypothetical protein